METKRLPLAKVKQNTGQIEGLPSNPREWTQTDIDRIAKSLKETPELFEARPLIVYPYNGEYIILGGNLRFEGAKKNKMKDVPVHILAEGMSIDKLKEIVIKDNGSFGAWDMDMLANEWDDLPLKDWGVDAAWDVKEVDVNSLSDDFSLPSGDKEPFQQMTFLLADAQAAEIKEALEEAKGLEEYKTMITFGNSNTNGNALAYIVEQWIESRKYN
jgi:hypothetical protein